MAIKPSGDGHRPPKQPRQPSAPDLQWAIDTGFRYLRSGDWLPLLVEFRPERDGKKDGSLQRFIRLGWLDPSFKGLVHVPELIQRTVQRTAALRDSQVFNFCVLWIRRDRMAEIARHASWRKTIVRAELGPPIQMPADQSLTQGRTFADSDTTPEAEHAVEVSTPSTMPLQQASMQQGTSSQPRVAIGVIDQGIAFAHERFRNKSGARVQGIWLQDASASAGLKLTKLQIDAAIGQAATLGQSDEAIYRNLGVLDYSVPGYKPLAMRRAHGTHVLDLAAGAALDDDVTDRPIIAVEMPEDAVGDPVGSTLTTHALSGIFYILECAESIRAAAETLPVVINLSYGPHDGPHDGSSAFERSVDLIQQLWETTQTPVRFVFAAGNSRQASVHARATISARKTVQWEWRVQPSDQTPSFMQLWFDSNKAAVELVPPSGRTLKVSRLAAKDEEPANSPSYSMAFQNAVPPSTKSLVSIFLSPTASDPPLTLGQPTVPSGVWKIRIRNRTAASIQVDGWARRDETLTGRRSRGRQARFDDPGSRSTSQGRPVEFGGVTATAYVDRHGTLSGITTGKETFVVGGYCVGLQGAELRPTSYSSAGPHFSPQRTTRSPTLSFPSDDTVVCRGRLAAGTRSGSTVAMNGSSAAAPQATRWIADQRASTGSFPKPPLVNPPLAQLVQPIFDPQRPIPMADIPLVAGDGLMQLPATPGRPSRTAPV